jgi:medium-chain acyl-[acyl-carrier-protein] hydrolase
MTGCCDSNNKWLASFRRCTTTQLRLFCFPYAGGGAHVYRTWATRMPPSVELCAINLPGRGTRLTEQPYNDAELLVVELARKLGPYLDKPYAFFGHSMGAMVCFELARQLRSEGRPLPVHLFVSGCHAPQLPDPHPVLHLSEPEFLDEICELGGIPPELLENKELMDLIMPAIRADFSVVESYSYTEKPPLECPVTVFGGHDDHLMEPYHLEAWRSQTSADFDLKMFPGNHFFIHSSQDTLLQSILQKLQSQLR